MKFPKPTKVEKGRRAKRQNPLPLREKGLPTRNERKRDYPTERKLRQKLCLFGPKRKQQSVQLLRRTLMGWHRPNLQRWEPIPPKSGCLMIITSRLKSRQAVKRNVDAVVK